MYSNVEWVGDPTNCHFTGDSLFSWCSKKQYVVACSNTKGEYRSLVDTIFYLLWLRWLLQDMSVHHIDRSDTYVWPSTTNPSISLVEP